MKNDPVQILRGYMFGNEEPNEWPDDLILEALQSQKAFVDYVMNECDWKHDIPGYNENEIRSWANSVFIDVFVNVCIDKVGLEG